MTYQVTKTHYADQTLEGFTPHATIEEFMTNVIKYDSITAEEFVNLIVSNTELEGAADFGPILKNIFTRDYISMEFNADAQSVSLTREWDTEDNFNKYKTYYSDVLDNTNIFDELNKFIAYNVTEPSVG